MAGATILVVEGDPTMARALTALLQHWGYQVTTAEDAIAAVVACSHELPAAVLADAGPPARDAVPVARSLKADLETRTVPIIGFQAEDDAAAQLALAAGCVECLLQPLDTHRLLALLRLVAPLPSP
jgi:CheY-like chemotaxis protein